MFRSSLFIAVLLHRAVSAGVDMNHSINEVEFHGEHAQAGLFVFNVDGGDFRSASAIEPIYIRVSFDKNATLADTLVDQSSADPVLSQPINLAIKVNAPEGVLAAAEGDAVRIVRWVAGESHFWVEVRQSSNFWLNVGGQLFGPNSTHKVSFEIGGSARGTDYANDSDVQLRPSNLPFNTRANTAAEGDFADAVSSLMCVDLSDATLLADGTFNSLLGYDLVTYDHLANQGGGLYDGSGANNTGISFSDIFYVARGRIRECEGTQGMETTAGMGFNQGLATIRHTYGLNLSCAFGGQALSTQFNPGSFLRLTVTTPNVGFPGADAASYSSLPGEVVLNNDSAITVNGVTLYQELDLVFTGTAFVLAFPQAVDAFLNLSFSPQNGHNFHVAQSVHIANHEGPRDEAPYDGADQNSRCAVSLFAINDLDMDIVAPPAGDCLLEWPERNVLDLITIGLPCF